MNIELIGGLNAFQAKVKNLDGKGHRATVQISEDFTGDKSTYIEEELTRQLVGIPFDMAMLKELALQCFDPAFTVRTDLIFNGSTLSIYCAGYEKTLDPLMNLSSETARDQAFAKTFFSDEIKAAYIASLPFIDVPVAGETTTETVKIAAVTEKQVVEGKLADVVIEAAREEKREVQATQAFIQYKGELYASAAELSA